MGIANAARATIQRATQVQDEAIAEKLASEERARQLEAQIDELYEQGVALLWIARVLKRCCFYVAYIWLLLA